MRRVTKLTGAVGASIVMLAAIGACGSNDNGSGSSGGDDGGAGDDGGFGGCAGLECQKPKCDNGGTTTISGKVYDPAGKVPLYNVIVYIPNAQLKPFPSGVSCDKCGATLTGNPIAVALTDSAGHFQLKDVPAGQNIPIVMQIGKWRRQVTLPNVASCADTAVDDANLMRLPRNKSEGDIPQIAMVTGGCDPLECLMRKIGIDDSEFTGPFESGRVHVYTGYDGASVATSKNSLQLTDDDGTTLSKYDIVLLACECATHPEEKPAKDLQNMFDYANKGGRVFASHYHYYWFESGPAPFPTVATWNHIDTGLPQNIVGTVDDTFPKGKALKDWLVNVGASQTPGQLPINEPRKDVDTAAAKISQRWIYNTTTLPGVQYMTFNTPIPVIDDQKCGRVVYSDLHVASGDQPGAPFPGGCQTTDLSPQEKALEFMLFDLSSCIQTDNEPPNVPK